MRRSSSQTRRWNTVPRISSGSLPRLDSPSMNERIFSFSSFIWPSTISASLNSSSQQAASAGPVLSASFTEHTPLSVVGHRGPLQGEWEKQLYRMRWPLPSRAIVARRHAEVLLLVEARDRAVAGLEHRIGHAAPRLKRRLYRFDAVRVLVVARRDAEGFLEAPLQVERARADRAGELAPASRARRAAHRDMPWPCR